MLARPFRSLILIVIIAVLSWLGWCKREAPKPVGPKQAAVDEGGPYGAHVPPHVVESFAAAPAEEALNFESGWGVE